MQWNVWVFVAGFILLAFLTWKEISRPNKARLLWRLFASVVTVAGLVCMAFPIYIPGTNKNLNDKTEVILLTGGYNKDSVELFVKQNKTMPVYHMDSLAVNNSIVHKKIHVFGYGLSTEEWNELEPSKIIFHPSVTPFGINSIYWKQQLVSGETLMVQGIFNNTATDSVKILLTGFDHHFDSLMIAPKQTKTFELTTVPSHTGRAVYNIAIQNGSDITEEPLPVNIYRSGKLNVLMLAASPDFENKFLSQWLSGNGYVVAMRTAISKNKFTQTFLDTSKFKLDRLTPELLNKFDIIIADASELQSISSNELAYINQQVSDKGCGLVVKADTIVGKSLFYSQPFTVTAPAYTAHEVVLHLPAISQPAVLAMEQPVYIHQQQSIRALISDDKNNMLAASTLYGSGKIIYTTLSNSFSWVLSGSNKNYAALWSALLDEAAQAKSNEEQWRIYPLLPKVNEPAQLYLHTMQARPAIEAEKSFVALKQNKIYPVEWSGNWWPVHSGWNNIQSSKSSLSSYAFKEDDWKNISLLKKEKDTWQYKKSSETGTPITSPAPVHEELSKIYFLLLLLIACTFLWIEKKFV